MHAYARAAVSAATKPTADLGKLTRHGPDTTYGFMEQRDEGAYVLLADVQSLLATKPAAAQAVPEGYVLVPKVPTAVMVQKGGHINSEYLNDYAPIGEQRYHLPMVSVWEAMLAAAPAASTIGAAQTADQEDPLHEEGTFYTVAKARGFTDFGLTIKGDYSDPNLQALYEKYEDSKPTTTQN